MKKFFLSVKKTCDAVDVSSAVKSVSTKNSSGSIKNIADNTITFTITDYQNELEVEYTGLIPNLFKELQGTVATGALVSNSKFKADELLAKHDENYMPKEVYDSLKKSGHWKE